MKKDPAAARSLQRYLQCFGEFNVQDSVCRQVCALRLRCAVESGRQERMEMMEELFSGEEAYDWIH